MLAQREAILLHLTDFPLAPFLPGLTEKRVKLLLHTEKKVSGQTNRLKGGFGGV